MEYPFLYKVITSSKDFRLFFFWLYWSFSSNYEAFCCGQILLLATGFLSGLLRASKRSTRSSKDWLPKILNKSFFSAGFNQTKSKIFFLQSQIAALYIILFFLYILFSIVLYLFFICSNSVLLQFVLLFLYPLN